MVKDNVHEEGMEPKKEDFYGRWFFRPGDLIPIEVRECYFFPSKAGNILTTEFCKELQDKGLLFNTYEDALLHYRCMMGAMKMDPHPAHREDRQPKKPRIYISGPISNTNREECFKAFKEAEEFLESNGYRAFSPLKNGLPFEADVHLHMRRDLNILTNEDDPFDYIYMLRRWPHSSGCKTELDTAVASGITVVFEESREAIRFV